MLRGQDLESSKEGLQRGGQGKELGRENEAEMTMDEVAATQGISRAFQPAI